MPFLRRAFENLKARLDEGEEPSHDEQATMIPATILMISGCRDAQTSADVSNVQEFCLPDPAGKAGGACTSALLRVLYNDERTPETDLSYVQVLEGLRDELEDGFTQVPQLSSSRPFDLENPFVIGAGTGTRRALLVGINYVGTGGELSGCHNDVINIKKYIMEVHGFEEDNIVVLMDDGENAEPTGSNIMRELERLAEESESGDSVFFHYSGHGASIRDDNGDEKDGMDEALCPIDYATNGLLRDDTIYTSFIAAMQEGVRAICLMDCCHSGSIMDLPYTYRPGSGDNVFVQNPRFKFGKFLRIFGAAVREVFK